GIWGTKTKQSIAAIKYGAKGELTKTLQAALYLSGYTEVGQIDGVYGSKTKEALEHFQKDKGLSVDHIAGKETFEALLDYCFPTSIFIHLEVGILLLVFIVVFYI